MDKTKWIFNRNKKFKFNCKLINRCGKLLNKIKWKYGKKYSKNRFINEFNIKMGSYSKKNSIIQNI
jgi:hypothetical protein